VHNILQCLCSQELIEPKLTATSAATSYSVFPPLEAPNSPLPAADPTPKLSSAAVASTSPEAPAAVPKAVAEAVAVPEPPPVTAIGPDTGATVRLKAADKTFDWYKVGDLAQDWQARQAPAFQRIASHAKLEPPSAQKSFPCCLLCQARTTLGTEVLSLQLLVARSSLE
jgi:hypothetical protein